jgi:beta-1,2-mannobiose phosphorylase / 1,2-beta-oligomannan phosphorylase
VPPLFTRHPDNPIVVPGLYDWRLAVTFNPGVLLDDDGRFYLYERAAGGLAPFICVIGMLESDDGVHFRHTRDRPVMTPEMCGSPYGSVQDPRVVKMDGVYYMTFAYRPYAWSSFPTGVGVPVSRETDFPDVPRPAFDPNNPGSSNVAGGRPDNMTRSGLAVSTDRVTWKLHSWITEPDIDDRDVILFPERIGGKYAVLRRPLQLVGPAYGCDAPSMWLSFSADLLSWSRPTLLAKAMSPWEGGRVGGSTPPIKTPDGWLVFYHGVQNENEKLRRVVYRMGAMLLDLENPMRVLARTREPLLEPVHYYERVGCYIPNVVFPTGAVVKDGVVYLYYGCCDTSIALATCPLSRIMAALSPT